MSLFFPPRVSIYLISLLISVPKVIFSIPPISSPFPTVLGNPLFFGKSNITIVTSRSYKTYVKFTPIDYFIFLPKTENQQTTKRNFQVSDKKIQIPFYGYTDWIANIIRKFFKRSLTNESIAPDPTQSFINCQWKLNVVFSIECYLKLCKYRPLGNHEGLQTSHFLFHHILHRWLHRYWNTWIETVISPSFHTQKPQGLQ